MNKKFLIIGGVVGLIFVVLAVFFILNSLKGLAPQAGANLTFWGVYDSSSYYTDIISKYEKANPNIKINYRELSYADYEKNLIDAFASGTGPDIWLMHNTWLPKHGDKISPLPQKDEKGTPLFSVNDFQNQFVDVAGQDLILKGQIYALPTYIDTLALFYNKDLLNSAGIAAPPVTWEEFNNDVKLLTKYDKKGHVTQAGAAIGTSKNINRSVDILMLLMLQSGVQMTNPEHTTATFSSYVNNQSVGEDALRYYTDFANPSKEVYCWDDQQHYSINGFAEGTVAMMLNYSHQIQNLHTIAPRFNFAVSAVPQIKTDSIDVSFANYWAPTVSKQSAHTLEAWKFLIYLSSQEGATSYFKASGRPPARRDLITSNQNEPDIGVFAKQALSAHSWFQIDSNTIETIFSDMIDNVNYGRASVRDALQSGESQVNVLMRKSGQ